MDIEQALRKIVGQQVGVRLATVAGPVRDWRGNPHVRIRLQPGNRIAEARVAYIGAGPNAGVLTPLEEGTEVLVLVPHNRIREAVVLAGFHSQRSPIPPSWNGSKMRVQHPGGTELRAAEGDPAHGIVLGTILSDLQGYVKAIAEFVTTIGAITTPAQLEQLAAAAVAFDADPAVIRFTARLAQSAAQTSPDGGEGGSPYASSKHRATE